MVSPYQANKSHSATCGLDSEADLALVEKLCCHWRASTSLSVNWVIAKFVSPSNMLNEDLRDLLVSRN